MNLSFHIATRYLFSKKSHQVINIISGVAIAGVTLATVAMVCTLSVFNGFKEMVVEQFTMFDPDIKVTATRGKNFILEDSLHARIKELPGVNIASIAIEDKAMVQYRGRQAMVTIKGVEDGWAELNDIRNSLVGTGSFILDDSINSYALPGIGIVSVLNCGLYYVDPLEIFAPRRGARINLTLPAANFKKGLLQSSGLSFITNQPKYDEGYILTSLPFARELFGREEKVATSLEIKLAEGCNIDATKENIANILGEGVVVEDRYEQQKDIFKVMRIEKLISYIFLSFILLIACFNIIGSLSMLIIEKRENMKTLRAMGATNKMIADIFILEGSIISAIGAFAGIAIGIAVCLLQQEYGLLTLGGEAEGFVVNSYPVKVEAEDIATTFLTVLIVGLVAVWLPVKLLTGSFIGKDN